MKIRTLSILSGAGALLLSGLIGAQAQDTEPPLRSEQMAPAVVEHPECSYFVQRNKKKYDGPDSGADSYRRSQLTQQVTKMLSSPSRAAVKSFEDPSKFGTIDKYLFADMQANNITPANKTDDFEFIRRVTLDLTGRIPALDRVLSFAADKTPDKRAKLIDELLAKPERVDKR